MGIFPSFNSNQLQILMVFVLSLHQKFFSRIFLVVVETPRGLVGEGSKTDKLDTDAESAVFKL